MATITLDELKGRITDLDSHEVMPVKLWERHFGEAGVMMAPMASATGGGANSPNVDVDADELPIDENTVWTTKGARAPGAIDNRRRLEVLDLMGVDRQLVFPGFGLIGVFLAASTPDSIAEMLKVDADDYDVRSIAIAVLAAHNEWAARETKIDPHRLRMVGTLATFELGQMLADAEALVGSGVRAAWIPASVPPGGLSPADRLLDPFWSTFEDADVPVLLHIGGEFSLFATRVWKQTPDFEPDPNSSLEFPLDPYTLATTHFAQQNFMTAMVLGGVFERHPRLRFGVIECGAHWVGPFADQMDMWASKFPKQMSRTLSMPPSEYLRRNFRVTPMYFERVDKYIERFGLEDVYCYASDYPHVEGGKSPMLDHYERLAPLGDEILEKFFVTNGDLLVPN